MSATGNPNCGWLKRLKNSARKFRPIPSRGNANCLMTEKSVLTKPGPKTGTRFAFPSWPAAGATKHDGLMYCNALWLAADTSQPAIWWPVEVVSVAAVVKEDARLVVAVDQWIGKSRRDLLNQRQLPVSEQRIRHPVPVIAESLTTTQRQIIEDTGGEVIREVDLRRTPVELLPIWQWKKRSACQ